MKKTLLILVFILHNTINYCAGQQLLDSCFTSAVFGPTFIGSVNLTNASDADLLQWNGTFWDGAWANANITIPPPCNAPPIRAVWMGDQTVWTSGGESFGLKFSPPLVSGNTYVFYFTYVSDGMGSNGLFSPDVYTNNNGGFGGNAIGNLDTVGYSWQTRPFIFTASPAECFPLQYSPHQIIFVRVHALTL